MTANHPGSEQQSELIAVLDCVTLPAIPTVLALHHPEDGVLAWVFAMPGGQAYLVPSDGRAGGWVHTSLRMIVRRWAPLRDADLVLVAA
ncbi:MAG: hypothetical protein ACRDTE_13645 [Pseudonocardiaceae bacterium]